MESAPSRVLIVDDMPINRMVIASLLAANGVMSDLAESGLKCLELCEKQDYDLILLDHRMPDFDGVDTLVALKELYSKKGRSVPVICHTTEEGRSNINLYKAAGFADVLIKPIDPRLLSNVLMTYLPEKDRHLEDKTPAHQSFSDTEADAPDEITAEDELDRLPLWLKTVPHIDLVSGIENCGDAQEYMEALFIFYSSISEKAEEISSYLENDELTMYRLTVHSLKSMARLVGARDLYERSKVLEEAAVNNDMGTIILETPQFLSDYRRYETFLSPIKDDEYLHRMLNEAPVETPPAPKREKPARNILFIHTNRGVVTTGIEINLKESGFTVISIPDDPDAIIRCRFNADIIIYYPQLDDSSHIRMTMNLLGEICQDDSKILCLTGDVFDLEHAMDSTGASSVCRTYPRPVDINHFIRDMKYLSDLLDDFHRRKTLYIVDDDPDYLSVINNWMSADYHVSCFRNGNEILDGLSAAIPDLILIDYEMPDMNGYELMQLIRMEEETQKIPIIFLTGKNDRDLVFKVLKDRPDGYLLKTSQKEALLDAIHRFFEESLFSNAR